MYHIVKPLLFLFPPEQAHYLALKLLKMVSYFPFGKKLIRYIYSYSGTKTVIIGNIQFPNFIGLAAGFDKNAEYLHQLSLLGFGFIEVGTVTPIAQSGNPKPRLFRLKEDQALINRMGFNNKGVDYMVKKLQSKPRGLIVGGNIGKNKNTPNEEAVNDYLVCFRKLFPWVDYFVVNVSSPNTPNLRELQDKEPLTRLLITLQAENNKNNPKPIFLKIAPDLTENQLDDIEEIVRNCRITGIVATNTTIERENLQADKKYISEIGLGGLSGQPVRQKSTDVIRYLKSKNKDLVIIGVGGIANSASAKEKLDSGASLLQVYTGFVYQGPTIVKEILKGLH